MMKTIISLQLMALLLIVLERTFVSGYKNSKRGTQSSTDYLAEIYKTRPKLLHQETQESYREGTRGPCGPSMAFEQSPTNPRIGICSCVASNGCSSNNPRYNRTGPLIRHPETNQCYRINSQGPCMTNSVLMKDTQTGSGVCRYPSWDCGTVPNINEAQIRSALSALNQGHEFDFIKKDSKMYVYNETCYRTWTQGHCATTKVMTKGGRRTSSSGDGLIYAVFVGTMPEPYCFSKLKYAIKAVTCRGRGQLQGQGQIMNGVQLVDSGECPQHFKRVGLDCVPETS